MNKVISTEKVPIKMWLDDIEEGALEQAKNLANLPFTYKHIAIMPDAHYGYGMCVGGVMATKGTIIPFAVGSDIGCGMVAIKTRFTRDNIDKRALQSIVNRIRQYTPVGMVWHKEKQDSSLMPIADHTRIVDEQYEKALYQIGTLGSGNHFQEIQTSLSGDIWIMLHSGSRNIGYKVAEHYNKIAIQLNERWYSEVPKEWQLAFLPIETQEAKDYLIDMQYCVDFAFANRKLMMQRILRAFEEEMQTSEVTDGDMINIAHNYAKYENHFGKNVIVHRKGATSAREGEIGIIPGSQGSKSYIVSGKGNPESFQSCSHGAGRKMGRNEAKKKLDLDVERKKLDDQGIIHNMTEVSNLDEAEGAYKDISVVMNNQQDLVDIVHELSPLAVIKDNTESKKEMEEIKIMLTDPFFYFCIIVVGLWNIYLNLDKIMFPKKENDESES